MKKIPGFLLILLVAFQPGCKKTNDTLNETSAHVLYGGRPEVDGLGYYIHLDASGENVIPLNLPSTYQQPAASAVMLKFVDTGKRQIVGDLANGGLRVVYVVAIRGL